METKKQDIQTELRRLCNELGEIEEAERMERNKALVGKCYRYRNSYGADMPRWWIYFLVTGPGTFWPEAFSFQFDKQHLFTIERGKGFSLFSSAEEISREAFDSAWLKFQKMLPAPDSL